MSPRPKDQPQRPLPPATTRARLTPERILAKAAQIYRNDGSDGLTIRQLAEGLQVTPMAIYRHFENKEALLSALLDQFIRNAGVLPDKPLPWDEWIMHVGREMWRAQVSDPDWITLLGSVQIRSGGLGVLAQSLDLLVEAGFSPDDALEAFFAMVHISIGASCLELGLRQLDLRSAFGRDDMENLQRLLNRFQSVEQILQAQQIERSLRLLVDGLRNRRSPPAR